MPDQRGHTWRRSDKQQTPILLREMAAHSALNIRSDDAPTMRRCSTETLRLTRERVCAHGVDAGFGIRDLDGESDPPRSAPGPNIGRADQRLPREAREGLERTWLAILSELHPEVHWSAVPTSEAIASPSERTDDSQPPKPVERPRPTSHGPGSKDPKQTPRRKRS